MHKKTKMFLRLIIGVIIVVSLSCSKKFPLRKNTYALVIGVSKYEDPSIPALEYAERDAKAISNLFKANGIEHIYTLTGRDATYSNIRTKLYELQNITDKESSVYIFFSFHGSPILSKDKQKIIPYLLPYDAKKTNIISLKVGAISISDIKEIIEGMPAKNVIVFINACYSQLPQGAASINVIPIKEITLSNGRFIMTAADSTQLAYEIKRYRHSIFTYRLLEALKGADREADENQDGWIDVNEAFNWVKEKVLEDAISFKNTRQTPTLIGSGNFKITRWK